jgi:ribosomal protein L16 Arg81 hydroxylase
MGIPTRRNESGCPSMWPQDFDELILPLSAEHFCESYYNKQFVHIHGNIDRVRTLFTWSSLNRILRQQQTRVHQIRLIKEGSNLAPERFTKWRFADDGPFLWIDLDSVVREIRMGATLVVDSIDECSTTLRKLADALEWKLSESIHANIYASFHTTRGLDTHWDNHGVFIVGLAGTKRWRVFEPTESSPCCFTPTADRPAGPPFWEGLLQPGDVMYIPRGWWHDATPLGEPVIHLTMGIGRNTGVELGKWLAARLTDSDLMRADLPRFGTLAEQQRHATLLRQTIRDHLGGVSLADYFSDTDSSAPRRIVPTSLPWDIAPPCGSLPNNARLQWMPPRKVTFEKQDNQIRFRSFGRKFACSSNGADLLEYLQDRRNVQFGQLIDAHPDLESEMIKEFIQALISFGILVIVAEDDFIDASH